MISKHNCPCGLPSTYLNCCAIFIEQDQLPATAKQLMRSRYTAYTLARINYIRETMLGQALKGFDAVTAKQFAEYAQWQSLTIIAKQQGGPEDSIGYVEFIARFKLGGKAETIHERSEFHKLKNRWYYVAGQ